MLSETALLFLAMYMLGLFLALFRDPLFGLYTYLLTFYNPPDFRWWGSELPDLRWSLIAALVTLIAVIRMQSSTTRPPWYTSLGARLLIVFTVWVWLQSLWALDPSAHSEGRILFTKYVILFYLIYRIVADEKTLELFCWGHVVGCLFFGWLAFTTVVRGRLEGVGGPGVDNANTFGMHETTGLAFAGFMFLGFCGKKRLIALIAIPFILNAIILSQSRGAFLSLLIAGITALYLAPRSSRRAIYGASALGAMLFFMLANEQFWTRMDTLTVEESERDVSANSRIGIIRYGWEMSKDHPWGTGHRGHNILSLQYMPPELLPANGGTRSAHNTFMAVLVDHGYPGFILYFCSSNMGYNYAPAF